MALDQVRFTQVYRSPNAPKPAPSPAPKAAAKPKPVREGQGRGEAGTQGRKPAVKANPVKARAGRQVDGQGRRQDRGEGRLIREERIERSREDRGEAGQGRDQTRREGRGQAQPPRPKRRSPSPRPYRSRSGARQNCVPFLRLTRDRRGYEHTFLLHADAPGQRPRVLYWYRTAPDVLIGRPALDEDAIRGIEEQHPLIEFDWPAILALREVMPPEDEAPPARPVRRGRPSRREPPPRSSSDAYTPRVPLPSPVAAPMTGRRSAGVRAVRRHPDDPRAARGTGRPRDRHAAAGAPRRDPGENSRAGIRGRADRAVG